MNGRAKIIGRSLLSLVATVAIGGGVTYALFTSNQVSIASNTVSTGDANLRVCDGTANSPTPIGEWRDSITTNMTFAGLNPGATDQDVMNGMAIYLGNDDGTLDTAPVTNCDNYAVTAGNSSVNMTFVPTVGNIVCSSVDPAFASTLQIRYGFTDVLTSTTVYSTYKTVANWATNTTDYGADLTPGNAVRLSIQAKLASTYSTPAASCTFDSRFVGEQA